MEYWSTSWEICMQVRKQQLELDMEQQTGSKLGKEYVKAVYCHPAYLIYMQSSSWETLGWMKQKLESRLPGELPNLGYAIDAAAAAAKSLQSCPTLCNPIDGSPPGSAVPGILQERVLECVAIAFSGYAVDTTLMAESKDELKSFLMEVKEESDKVGLKISIQSHRLMSNRWGNNGNSERLYFGGLQMVTAAIKLKDTCSWEEKLWPI